MKISIGNYPSRLTCNIHTRYMDKKYGYVDWPEEQTRFERNLEWLEDLIQSLYSPINYFLDRRERKVKVHVNRWDTWNMDETVAHIVFPMLRQLKETKHGAPWVDNEDVPEELHISEDWYEKYSRNGETDPHFFDRWEWVMDEMIFAFESKIDPSWEEQFQSGNMDIIWEESEDGSSVMKKGPNHTFDIDNEAMKQYQKRISNGFRLFGKYYESLWD